MPRIREGTRGKPLVPFSFGEGMDRTIALVILLGGITAAGLLAWQSHRMTQLEALSASLRASNELLEESIKNERKSLTEALRGLELEMDEYRLKKELYESSVCARHEALDKSSEKAQECIRKELDMDASLEKQMELARKVVYDFSKK